MPGLASPLQVGHLTLRNRIIMPPMANNLADERGRVTDRLVEHYRRHAGGGQAMIVVEHAYITPSGRVNPNQLGIHEDGLVDGLSRLAEAIHTGGAVAVAQITHGGARCPSAATGVQPVGPSDIAVPGDKETPRPLTAAEIAELPPLFAAAAGRAIAAGFDGVEVHGAHGYLLNEFASPYTNRRTDAYGGSEAGRQRLIEEVLRATSAVTGAGKLMLYRLGADDGVPGGLSPSDAGRLACRLTEWAVDLVDCSGGLCGSRPAERTGQGFFVEPAGIVKAALVAAGFTIPVSGVGGITEPGYADRIVREGLVDAVCVGRAQLADPAWARRALGEVATA